MVPKQILKLTEICEYLGIPKRTFYHMIGDGRFDVAPIARTKPRRWRLEDIEAWRQRTEA